MFVLIWLNFQSCVIIIGLFQSMWVPSHMLYFIFQMAIIEYLEETKEGQHILPKDPVGRAQVIVITSYLKTVGWIVHFNMYKTQIQNVQTST